MKSFRKNNDGNVAVTFGIALVPIMLGVGLAIDYTESSQKRSAYQEALDSAVLSAAIDYNSHGNEAKAKLAGASVFASNCGSMCTDNDKPQFEIVSGDYVDGKVSGVSNGAFSGILGSKLEFDLDARVSLSGRPLFQDYWFVVDVSASLGIASSPSNVTRLMAETQPYAVTSGYAPNGCAFACHEVSPEGWERRVSQGGSMVPQATYDWANDEGIPLRNDVLQAEFHDALSVILPAGGTSGSVRAGLYVFSDTQELLHPLTTNAAELEASYTDANIGVRRWGTRHDIVLPQIAEAIGSNGSGASAADPHKTVVLVTDGVTSNYSTFDFRAIDPANCQAFKDQGVQIAVLDVTYPKLSGDGIFEDMVAPFYNQIRPALKACASPDLYYQAERDDDIARYLKRIVDETKKRSLALIR